MPDSTFGYFISSGGRSWEVKINYTSGPGETLFDGEQLYYYPSSIYPTHWYRNDSLLNTRDTLLYKNYVNDTLVPTKPGNYFAVNYNLSQAKISKPYDYNIISSNSLKPTNENGIYIFPTITNSLINIKGANGLRLNIYSLTGILIKSSIIDNEAINIADLKNGIYIVKIENKSYRIIKY